MLQTIIPKLPMRSMVITKKYYCDKLRFEQTGDFGDYLMIKKEKIEIHFFLFEDLNPKENYGQVYIRTDHIEKVYQGFLDNGIKIHPHGKLEKKVWKQKEFSILDPDHNLLTFGQSII